MTILGIETSGPACEVAVLRAPSGPGPLGELMARAVTVRLRRGTGRLRHAEALFALLDRALAKARVRRAGLDAVAVSIGPGSFTGLRVGLAAAKVLARFGGIALAGVPTLDAQAAGAEVTADRLVAVGDAMRGEVFAAAYRPHPRGPKRLISPKVCGPAALFALLGPTGALVTAPPGAAAVAALGALRLAAKPRGDDPDRLVPLYVRRPAAVEKLRSSPR